MVPLENYLILSAIIFSLGVYGVLARRNAVLILMSVELMLNAVNIVFITASRTVGNVDGQIMVFFVMTVAACEAAVGLAMVIAVYRRYGTIKSDFLRLLRG